MLFCRCCLLADQELHEMRSVRFVYNSDTIPADEGYKFCNAPDGSADQLLAIPEVDDNPMICKMCLIQLESAYIFLKLCREASNVLKTKEMLKVKIEPIADRPEPESDDNDQAHEPSPKRIIKEELPTNGDPPISGESSANSSPLPACFMQNKVQCKFCSRIFVTKGVGDQLWVHCFEHRGYEPFNCAENGCFFQTRHQKNFRTHLRKSHNIEYDEAVHGYKEDYQSVVNYLVGSGEADAWHSNLMKKFECAICGMKFTRKIQQMRHFCAKSAH